MATWRPGKHGGVQVDTDPYSGATLAEPVMANQGDLDEAYHAAAKAQISWAARLPAEGAAVMLCSASIMEARHGFGQGYRSKLVPESPHDLRKAD